MQGRISIEYAERFITAGKAQVMFWNTETNNKFWFTVHEMRDSLYAVNWIVKDSLPNYIGHINTRHVGAQFHRTAKGIWNEPKSHAADVFAFMWKRIRELNVPEQVHILHLGKCGVCGRPLTDPVSIEVGIGPICRGEKR